jgi:hypothetical protein
MPTYMGFRLMALAPLVTNTDARSGWNGSRVVPLRRKRLAAVPAIEKDTSEMAATPTVRRLLRGRVPAGSRRWSKAAAAAAAGGGMRGTASTLRLLAGFVEKPRSSTAGNEAPGLTSVPEPSPTGERGAGSAWWVRICASRRGTPASTAFRGPRRSSECRLGSLGTRRPANPASDARRHRRRH